MALQTQKLEIPLAAGLNQKVDQRAIPMPALTRAVNVQFDEAGGLQTRKPFDSTLSLNIHGGGTLESTEFRRLAVCEDELLLWTRTKLYSRSDELEAWVDRGEHLAIKVEERTVFATRGDQIDADRVELNGIAMYGWYEVGGGTYVACLDATTGTCTFGPYRVTQSTGSSRPRLVALDDRVLFFFNEDLGTDGLYCYSIDPLDPATALGGPSTTVINSVNQAVYYDAVRIPGANEAAVVMRRTPSTSYSLIRVTATPTVTAGTKARPCDGPISIAACPDGIHLQIVRADGTNIEGDLVLASTFGDVLANQAIGTADDTPVNQIGLEFFDIQVSGAWRAQVYWSAAEADVPDLLGGPFQLRTNWVDTNNNVGVPVTDGLIAYMLGVASRPFAHDGHVYVWTAFAGTSSFSGANAPGFRAQLQNTYFLYREDGRLCGKSVAMRAGGLSPSTCHLPQVNARGNGVFTFVGAERRIVATGSSGKQKGYESRAVRDVTITFDSNDARRSVQLGRTMYVTGAELLQFDGSGLYEVGFHVYPWFFLSDPGPGGSLEDGDYAYKASWRWLNARGETERSTTATVAVLTISGSDRLVDLFAAMQLVTTHKGGLAGDSKNIAAEWWRTAKNPTDDAPFYLVTSPSPGDYTNPQRFIESAPLVYPLDTVQDGLVDADLTTRQSHPENGTVLECLSPPPATIVIASADRLFIAGIPGDPSRIWYSRLRGDGEVASFHDALTTTIPATAGAITAIGYLNETLVAFTAGAVYALPGDGIDNVGGNQTFGPARLLASDVGALSQEAVALTPDGLVFKSSKGWYLLDRGWSPKYIGAKVCDYDDEDVIAVHVLPAQHQLRVVTPYRVLVLDTNVNEWAEWTVAGAIDSIVWRGQHTVLDETGIRVQRDDFTGVEYGMDVEVLVKLDGLQGFGRVRKLLVLGEYRSAHKLRLRVARDYKTDYFDDVLWIATPTDVGGPLQVQHGPSQQQVQAMRIRITPCGMESVIGNDAPVYPPSGEALKLTSLAIEVGMKNPVRRVPAAWRK